jgi:uncharacterized protein (TIGR03435 family)
MKTTTKLAVALAMLGTGGMIVGPESAKCAEPGVARAEAFEVASVRRTPADQIGYTSISPSGAVAFVATNASLPLLIQQAFGVTLYQLSNVPSWADSEHYDVSAKPEGPGRLSYEQLRPLLQTLLRERFNLVAHRETRNVEGYVLVIAKGGPKLQPSKGGAAGAQILFGSLQAHNVPLDFIASILWSPLKRPVVNKTGLDGKYDITLKYSTLETDDLSVPSIFVAVQETLGLKLESQRVPMEFLVVDHVERVPKED